MTTTWFDYTTITYKGHSFECSCVFHKHSTSSDRDEEPIGDSVEITKVTFDGGTDDITELLADVGWLPEIEKLILEKL